jgi:hypothetical protein
VELVIIVIVNGIMVVWLLVVIMDFVIVWYGSDKLIPLCYTAEGKKEKGSGVVVKSGRRWFNG